MEAQRTSAATTIVSFHQVYADLAARYQVALVPFLLQGVAGVGCPQWVRRHSSDGGRGADCRRQCVGGASNRCSMARAGACAARERQKDRRPMIELRDVSKTVTSGAKSLTILHPLTVTFRRGSSSPSSGRPAAASRRFWVSSRGSTRRRQGRSSSTASTSRSSMRTASRGCAARRSASCSSSFTSIPSLTAYENIAVPTGDRRHAGRGAPDHDTARRSGAD